VQEKSAHKNALAHGAGPRLEGVIKYRLTEQETTWIINEVGNVRFPLIADTRFA
jgi:hypothetical protein